MTDFKRYTNVSLLKGNYQKIDKLRKIIVPNAILSRAQTINILVNEKASKLLNGSSKKKINGDG